MTSFVGNESQCLISTLSDMISKESPLYKLRERFDLDAICNSVKLRKHHFGARGLVNMY
jgi:hypothetical protein